MLALGPEGVADLRFEIPQDVPPVTPDAHWWETQREGFDRFRPQPMRRERPMPHIRMDAALEFLLGDKLI